MSSNNINILINILTRTGNRENDFKTLNNSIKMQSYKNIRHLKSNDNPNCKYLKSESDVISVLPNKDSGICFYNLYLNELGMHINEGWVIILDDDSKVIDQEFIKRLSINCYNSKENDILIFQSLVGRNKRSLPNNIDMQNKNFRKLAVDMACFCIHYSILKDNKFTASKGGDINFLNLLQDSKKYNFKYLNMPIGIWANYNGSKRGKN